MESYTALNFISFSLIIYLVATKARICYCSTDPVRMLNNSFAIPLHKQKEDENDFARTYFQFGIQILEADI